MIDQRHLHIEGWGQTQKSYIHGRIEKQINKSILIFILKHFITIQAFHQPLMEMIIEA